MFIDQLFFCFYETTFEVKSTIYTAMKKLLISNHVWSKWTTGVTSKVMSSYNSGALIVLVVNLFFFPSDFASWSNVRRIQWLFVSDSRSRYQQGSSRAQESCRRSRCKSKYQGVSCNSSQDRNLKKYTQLLVILKLGYFNAWLFEDETLGYFKITVGLTPPPLLSTWQWHPMIGVLVVSRLDHRPYIYYWTAHVVAELRDKDSK